MNLQYIMIIIYMASLSEATKTLQEYFQFDDFQYKLFKSFREGNDLHAFTVVNDKIYYLYGTNQQKMVEYGSPFVEDAFFAKNCTVDYYPDQTQFGDKYPKYLEVVRLYNNERIKSLEKDNELLKLSLEEANLKIMNIEASVNYLLEKINELEH